MNPKLDTSFSLPPSKLQASLWMSQRVLLTPEELIDLFGFLPSFELYSLSHVGSKEGFHVSKERFLELYKAFFMSFFHKKDMSFYTFKKQLTVGMTCKEYTLYLTEPSSGPFLIHMQEPSVVIGPCVFHYDNAAKKILYADHMTNAMRMGLEFKFPQFYQDPQTLQPVKHFTDPSNPNTRLFKGLQKWCRENAKVVFLEKDAEERFSPGCKVGNQCLDQLSNFFDLQMQGYKAIF
jgi:hypothetical protein